MKLGEIVPKRGRSVGPSAILKKTHALARIRPVGSKSGRRERRSNAATRLICKMATVDLRLDTLPIGIEQGLHELEVLQEQLSLERFHTDRNRALPLNSELLNTVGPRSGVILMVGNCRRRLLEGFETVSWAPTLT